MVACAQTSVSVIGCAQGEPNAVVQCCKRLFEYNATALVQDRGMTVKGRQPTADVQADCMNAASV